MAFALSMAAGGKEARSAPKRVVVVGGGVIGAASAYYLSRRGVKVEIIEAVQLGAAASGKAGGFLALDWNDEYGNPLGPLSKASFALHEQLAHEFGTERVGYRRVGAVAADMGGSGRTSKHAPYLGSVRSETVIGTKDTCAQVHPMRLTTALAEESGAQVTIGKVVNFSTDDGRVSELELEGHDRRRAVAADEHVLFTLGPWSRLVSEVLGLPNFYGQKALSIVVPTDPPLSEYSAFLRWRGKSPEVYPRSDEAYLCGFGDSPAEVHEAPGEVEPSETGAKALREFTADLLDVRDETLAVRACHLPLFEHGSPLIGSLKEFGAENAAIAAGHSCWGILNAPATGLAIAELLCDGEISVVPEWASQAMDPSKYVTRRSARSSARAARKQADAE